jgi:hypothetical protein
MAREILAKNLAFYSCKSLFFGAMAMGVGVKTTAKLQFNTAIIFSVPPLWLKDIISPKPGK